MIAFAFIFAVIALWLSAAVIWGLLFPPKCIHGRRRRSPDISCPDCVHARALADAESLRQAEAAKHEELRRCLEIDRLRAIEAENLRQLGYLQTLDPVEFENVVLQMYRNFGWEATATSRSCDGGIDGNLLRNGQRLILQCKRLTSNKVGSPVLRDLLGAAVKEKATGGILVTTSSFTEEATKWAKGQPITLISGTELIGLIGQAFPLGSPVPLDFVLKKAASASLPKVCPQCGRAAQSRRGRFAPFLGCAGFPECNWTMNLPPESGGSTTIVRRRRRRRWSRR